MSVLNTSVLDGNNCNIENNLILLASIPKLVSILLDSKLAWLRPSISSDYKKVRKPKRNLDFTQKINKPVNILIQVLTWYVKINRSRIFFAGRRPMMLDDGRLLGTQEIYLLFTDETIRQVWPLNK